MTFCKIRQMNSKCIQLSCLLLRIISCILVTNGTRYGAKVKISGEEMREFIVLCVMGAIIHSLTGGRIWLTILFMGKLIPCTGAVRKVSSHF